MKITNVTPMVMGTPWRNLLFVKVETDEGIVGWGEARPLNRIETMLGYLNEVTPKSLIGRDPFEIESLTHHLTREEYGRAGEIVMTGLAVIEMACWDIIGKSLNQPVYRLLGGAVRPKIKAYANGWYRVERTPEAFHEAAKRVIERGYRALKFDPFGDGYYEMERSEKNKVIALVEAVNDALTEDAEILLEMHGRFNPTTAINMITELSKFRIGWAEEPIPPENLKALRDVREAVKHLGVPIATGERIHTPYDYRELFELQAADIIQPDLTHFGGILNIKKLCATAETHYVLVAPHNVGGPISTAAALQIGACTMNFKIQEYFNDFADPFVKEAATGLPDVVDGYFALPEGPGLGIQVNEDIIAEHPMTDHQFNLFADDWQKRGMSGT